MATDVQAINGLALKSAFDEDTMPPPRTEDILRAVETQGAKIDRLCDALERKNGNGNGNNKINVVGWIGIAVVLIGHAVYVGRITERAELNAQFHKDELKRVEGDYARQVQELKDEHKATVNMYTNLRVAVERKGIRLQ